MCPSHARTGDASRVAGSEPRWDATDPETVIHLFRAALQQARDRRLPDEMAQDVTMEVVRRFLEEEAHALTHPGDGEHSDDRPALSDVEIQRRADLVARVAQRAYGRDKERRVALPDNEEDIPPDWSSWQPALSPEAVVEFHELARAVFKACGSAKTADMLYQRVVYEKTLAEIGARYGIGPDAVSGRLRRALSRIRAALEQSGWDASHKPRIEGSNPD
jgi:Sigma-70, region 4